MSVVLGALGISLITGGTSAYFTDATSTYNTITTGSLDLGLNKETFFQIEDLMPRDTQEAQFSLTNEGSIDMKEVTLNTSYEVADKGEPNNGDNLGDHIMVVLLSNQGGEETLIFKKTLSELSDNPQRIAKRIPAGSTGKNFTIQMKFLDNGENQNHFQTDQLKLSWEFEAVQLVGNT